MKTKYIYFLLALCLTSCQDNKKKPQAEAGPGAQPPSCSPQKPTEPEWYSFILGTLSELPACEQHRIDGASSSSTAHH